MKLLSLFSSPYGMALAVSIAVGIVFALLKRDREISSAVTVLAGALSILLCPTGARLYYLLTHNAGRIFRLPFFSADPYAYAFSGAVLGFIAAVLIAALLCRVKIGRLADSMTPPALLVVALARICEALSDFGWGPQLHAAWTQRAPIGIMDPLWQEWHLATFNLEALIAFAALAYVLMRSRRAKGGAFATGLLWWSMGQIFCETLRAECIRWGFVPVQQIQGAVFGLAILLVCAFLNRDAQPRFPVVPAALYLLGVGVVAFLEFAIDKCPWPVALDYIGMAAALVAMGIIVQKQIDLLPAIGKEGNEK